MISRIWTVARRELGSYFDHPTAYILVVIFLGINFFFFFRDAYLLGEASLRPMVGLLPWLLLFFVPAVSMRALAEERRGGTLELVLAQPISVLEMLLGKFVGVTAFLLIAMAGTFGVPIGLSWGADLQLGVMVAQYFGSALFIAALVAVGLWASSMTQNQVTAFILGVTVTFLLYMIGLPVVALGLPSILSVVATRLGILGHFEAVARGVIDLRDVLYFAALTAAFLALTYFSLMRERLAPGRQAYQRLRFGVLGLVGVAIFTALAGGQLRGRLDLTPGKLYTLSPATRQLLQDVNDLVTIKFFRSEELPPGFAPLRRDIEDLLYDFDSAGGANVSLFLLAPDENEDAAEEAQSLGIDAARFNVVGQDEMSVRDGYLGLAVQYAGSSEVIPLIRDAANLEYRLASMIRSMTSDSRPVAGLLAGHGEVSPQNEMQLAAGLLREEYEVESFMIDSTTTAVPDSFDVLIVAGGQAPWEPAVGQIIGGYLDGGGSVFLLSNGASVDPRSGFAGPAFNPALDSLLQSRGLGVVPSIVHDVRAHENVQIQSQAGFLIMGYPLWPFGQAASDHITMNGVASIPFRWASPLLIENADPESLTTLLTTTETGGRLQLPSSIDATQDWQTVLDLDALAVETLAVALNEPGGGRLVLVGSDSFIRDEVVRGSQTGISGMVFFQNAVDWLAQDEALISIRAKDRTPPQLLFSGPVARDVAKYGNMIGVPLLFVLFGVLRLARRRGRQSQAFEPGGALV